MVLETKSFGNTTAPSVAHTVWFSREHKSAVHLLNTTSKTYFCTLASSSIIPYPTPPPLSAVDHKCSNTGNRMHNTQPSSSLHSCTTLYIADSFCSTQCSADMDLALKLHQQRRTISESHSSLLVGWSFFCFVTLQNQGLFKFQMKLNP